MYANRVKQGKYNNSAPCSRELTTSHFLLHYTRPQQQVSELPKSKQLTTTHPWPDLNTYCDSAMVKSKLQILTSFFHLKFQILSAFGIKNAIFQGSVTKNSVILALKVFFLVKIGDFFHFFIKLCFLQWFKNLKLNFSWQRFGWLNIYSTN